MGNSRRRRILNSAGILGPSEWNTSGYKDGVLGRGGGVLSLAVGVAEEVTENDPGSLELFLFFFFPCLWVDTLKS